MQLTQGGEIIVGVLIMIIGAGIIGSIGWVGKALKRDRKERKLYWIKVDCMVFALKQVNHNFGIEFGKAYDEKFDEMMEEIDFVNKN